MRCSSRHTPGWTPPCGSRCSTRIRRRELPSRCARCGCNASRDPRQRRTRADATGGAALQIKTTASSTYRVWPNCGPLEPGETQRVQILLLGTKVSSRHPSCHLRRFRSRSGGCPRPLPAHCPPTLPCQPRSRRCRSHRSLSGRSMVPTALSPRRLPPRCAQSCPALPTAFYQKRGGTL